MSSAAPEPEVVVLPDHDAFVAEAAERIAGRCRAVVGARGECAIALTGGDTPGPIYSRLAREPYRSRIPWDRVRVFWGDERCVPPEDPRSNFRGGWETLLSHVPVPADHVHRMPGERADLDRAAQEYEALLRSHVPRGPGGWPCLDLVLLGLGANAHIASLFPHAPALHESARAVVAYYVAEVGMDRMTLTPPVLDSATEILFLVSGSKKAEAVWRTLEGPREPDAVPAQLVRPTGGRLVWLMDAQAASRLSSRPATGRARE
jgi:6-phosphogluconolactonase